MLKDLLVKTSNFNTFFDEVKELPEDAENYVFNKFDSNGYLVIKLTSYNRDKNRCRVSEKNPESDFCINKIVLNRNLLLKSGEEDEEGLFMWWPNSYTYTDLFSNKLCERNIRKDLFLKGQEIFSRVKGSAGVPDFLVINTKNLDDWSFVEVKKQKDALRINQLNWLINNPNLYSIIYYVVKTTHLYTPMP